MARFPQHVVPTIGANLMARLYATKQPLEYISVEVGDGRLGSWQPTGLTGLISSRLSLPIAATPVRLQDGRWNVKAVMSNRNLTAPMQWREWGIFATDPTTGNKVLVGYSNAGDAADPVYPWDGTPESLVEYSITCACFLTSQVEVTVVMDPTQVYILKQEFDEHTHTAADVGADAAGSAATALTNAKTYTDTAAADTLTNAKTYAAAEDAKVMTQFNNLATVATHTKSGIMHKLTLSATATEGLQQVAFMATAEYNEGDTWGVNGIAYTAEVAGEDGALPELLFVAGNIVSLTLDPIGKKLGFKSGGKPRVPDDFGDGSDGDLYIAAGETVVLPVLVPHQSIVVKQYKSVFIDYTGELKCSDPNAGLVIRCKGNCTIHGTIDQSLMAPKTNPSSTYQYPIELLCGAGGDGGKGATDTGAGGNAPGGIGGSGMAVRAYGGGYGGGAGGAGQFTRRGGAGGASESITVFVSQIFIGGVGAPMHADGNSGIYGGGGAAGAANNRGPNGGSGAGGAGDGYSDARASGGGAANYGGGVVLLYTGGSTLIDGTINCAGGIGGIGGVAYVTGGGGGGGGGGAIYICHNSDTMLFTGGADVSGGYGGASGISPGVPPRRGSNGQAGTIGTVTIKKYVKGMPV